MDRQRRTPALVAAAIGGLLVLTFMVDVATPLGYAEWALYTLVVGTTLVQSDARAPLVAAAVGSALMIAGFFASPPGIDHFMSIANRSFGAVAMWSVAIAIRHVLRTRNDAAELLWLQRTRTALSQALLGEQGPEQIGRNATAVLAGALGADVGVLYRLDGSTLVRSGGHAIDPASLPERIGVPEGVAGQVAADGAIRIVDEVPAGHLVIRTALGQSQAGRLVVAPIRADGQLCGVVELAALGRTMSRQRALALLDAVAETVGVALRSADDRGRLVALLEETRRQSEELQRQQDQLRVSNEELEEQSRVLEESQARLEVQQSELEQSNLRLEEQAQRQEGHKRELLVAQQTLLANAQSLESANRYKSEFLANMSHELRTPLNSALILSKLLAENRDGTLNATQVNYAKAIHASNNDLLALINNVLDLAKIEAGHLQFDVVTVELPVLLERLRAIFEPMALQKGLELRIEADADAPATIETDSLRLSQVLKNLMANAVKFTEHGHVHLRVLALPGERLAFEVRDTGVGIARDQFGVIFEAFRQADGGTSRRYGGTGLGLSISRELAQRLGGEILVDSEPGRGSVFTLIVPLRVPAGDAGQPAPAASLVSPLPARLPPAAAAPPAVPGTETAAAPVPADDRGHPRQHGRLVLCIEDDPPFAQVLMDLAHEQGFDCVIAPNAAEALRMAAEFRPDGILLDISLPDQSGLSVLERLKRDPATRHVPVHVVSAHERAHTAKELGAVGFLRKPADREQLVEVFRRIEQRLRRTVRRLLIVEDDAALRAGLEELLHADELEIVSVGSIADALRELEGSTFDCMVMDLTLPDGTGYDLLERIAGRDDHPFPPVIVYTGRALGRDDEERLRRYSKSIIVKGARSPERLLDDVTLFLHSVEAHLPADQQRLLQQARQRDAVLNGRRILLAEDDVRTIFALSSVFEPLGVHVEIARNGHEAIERLEAADVDLVLMDIMMPEMDGLTAIRRIRERPQWASLPVIALTAKAMSEDRERCLEAGASDYVAKPIDIEKLVSLCRVWMPK